jgi:hypothetical protein
MLLSIHFGERPEIRETVVRRFSEDDGEKVAGIRAT